MTLPSLRERAERTLEDIEGRFHLGNGFYREKIGTGNPGFAWAQGVLLTAFVAAAKHIDRRKYEPLLRRHFDALQAYWHPAGPVPGYNASRVGSTPGRPDRYYDDNAWIVLGLLDAHALTGYAPYKEMAERSLRFVLSGYDTAQGGGLYWHEQEKNSKNTASTAPGAVSALTMARQYRGGAAAGENSVWARRLYTWLYSVLRDPADGLYRDNINARNGRIEPTKWSYNSALVLRQEMDLADYWDTPLYRERAVTLADACLRRWYDREQVILKDDASFSHLLAEALLQAYDVTGNAAYRDAVLTSLDTLWTRVRRSDGSYPKHWATDSKETSPTELLWIASAARAYAFTVPYAEKGR